MLYGLCSFQDTEYNRRSLDGTVAAQMRSMQNVLDDLLPANVTNVPTQGQDFSEPTQNTMDPSQVAETTSRDNQWQQEHTMRATHNPVRGPTSPKFTLDVVKRRFREQGFCSGTSVPSARDDFASPDVSNADVQGDWVRSPALNTLLSDSLWDVDGTEAVRLIRLFWTTRGLMYPIFDPQGLITDTEALYTAMHHVQANGDNEVPQIYAERLLKYDSTTLKLVMAIATVSEKGSSDRFADRLLQSMINGLWQTIWRISSLKTLSHLLLLVSPSASHEFSHNT